MENLIKLSELLDLDTKGKTRLQIINLFEPFIGKTFVIIGNILQIGRNNIYLFPFTEHTKVKISFSEILFSQQLLDYNHDDKVSINAIFDSFIAGSSYLRHYNFSLISITKTDLPVSQSTDVIVYNTEVVPHKIKLPDTDLSITDMEKNKSRTESKQNGHFVMKILSQIVGSLWGLYLGIAVAVKVCSNGFIFGTTLPFYYSLWMISFGYLGVVLGSRILQYLEKSKGEWDEEVVVRISFWNWIHLGYPYLAAPFISTLFSEDIYFGLFNGYSTATIFYFMYLMKAFETIQVKTGRGFKTDFGTIDEVKNITRQNYTPKRYSGTIAFFHFLCGIIILIYFLAFK